MALLKKPLVFNSQIFGGINNLIMETLYTSVPMEVLGLICLLGGMMIV